MIKSRRVIVETFIPLVFLALIAYIHCTSYMRWKRKLLNQRQSKVILSSNRSISKHRNRENDNLSEICLPGLTRAICNERMTFTLKIAFELTKGYSNVFRIKNNCCDSESSKSNYIRPMKLWSFVYFDSLTLKWPWVMIAVPVLFAQMWPPSATWNHLNRIIILFD